MKTTTTLRNLACIALLSMSLGLSAQHNNRGDGNRHSSKPTTHKTQPSASRVDRGQPKGGNHRDQPGQPGRPGNPGSDRHDRGQAAEPRHDRHHGPGAPQPPMMRPPNRPARYNCGLRYLRSHRFITPADYARLTGLSLALAAGELNQWAAMEGSQIAMMVNGGEIVYTMSTPHIGATIVWR